MWSGSHAVHRAGMMAADLGADSDSQKQPGFVRIYGFEFVFACPDTDSRSACVTRPPAAIAVVAGVLFERNTLLATPQFFRDLDDPPEALSFN